MSPITEAPKERSRLLKEEAFTLSFLGVLVLIVFFVVYLCVAQAGRVDGHILHACLLGFAQTLPNHRGAMADVSSKHVH